MTLSVSWSESESQIYLSLTKYKRDSTNPEVHKQDFLEITSRHPKYVQIYTDASKVDEMVAAAAVSSVAPNSSFSRRLRDHCSIYTAELQAILFALKQVHQSKTNNKLMIFSGSLSALQALKNFKTDHPLLIQIQERLHKINADKKGTIFVWVPGNIGIRGNEAADRAAKEALNTEPTAGLVPFPDLKPLTFKYVCEVWQMEWDEAGLTSNKFMKFYQGFRANCYPFVTQGRKTQITYWSLISDTFIYFEKRGSCLCCV